MTNTKKIARLAGTNPKSTADLIERLELLLGPGSVSKGGKHLRVTRDGVLIATLPSTPSCGRSVLNTVRDLRHAGVDVKAMRMVTATVTVR